MFYRRLTNLVLAQTILGVCAFAADEPAGASMVQDHPATSPAEYVNQQLPTWIRLSGELRARGEGFFGNHFEAGNDDLYLLQRIRLGVQITARPWLKFFAQGQDSRVSFTNRVQPAPPYQDSADLRQAYVQIGSETLPFQLRVGRQELAFGEERLVGASNWGNVARSFDAVRLGLHHGGYQLDAFASSVVVARDHQFDKHVAGDNLHGLYGKIEGWIPKAKIEPFLFWRLAPRVVTEAGGVGRLDSKTIGARIAGSLPAKFTYTTEMVGQVGSFSSDQVRAWAGLWRIERPLTDSRFKPVLRVEVNHASGDKNPYDGKHGTFEVLYPTPHDKYGLADQVGWKNVHHIGVILEARPKSTLVLQLKEHEWWLASARDGLYNAGGALLVRDLTGTSGTKIGREIDVQCVWTASKHLQLAGGLGHMFAGPFLQRTTPGHGYTFPYISLVYGL
jgi:hypothetical protein